MNNKPRYYPDFRLNDATQTVPTDVSLEAEGLVPATLQINKDTGERILDLESIKEFESVGLTDQPSQCAGESSMVEGGSGVGTVNY